MAASAPSIDDIRAEAQAIQSEVNANPVSAADKAAIVSHAQKLLGLLDKLQPHLNQAQAAFGGQEQTMQTLTDLKNKLQRIIAAYSGK